MVISVSRSTYLSDGLEGYKTTDPDKAFPVFFKCGKKAGRRKSVSEVPFGTTKSLVGGLRSLIKEHFKYVNWHAKSLNLC